MASDYQPANSQKLGISTSFGRWPDGIVPYVYNPTGAPALFADDAYFVTLLRAAMTEIEGSADVTFDYQGIDTNAVIADTGDGIVTVGWEDIGGAAGTAGPSTGLCFGQDKIDAGYCPYKDGTVRFNNNGAAVDWDKGVTEFTERDFKQVAVHELMHLLGIGHSEQQQSIMYADPYTNLSHLRPDDIDALRSLYGRPDELSPASIYIPPATGPSPLYDSFISLGNSIGTEVTTVDGTEVDNFIGLLWWAYDGHTDDLTMVATDPSGYYYAGRLDDRDCTTDPPGNICGNWLSFAGMDKLFTLPGVWTVYAIMNGDLVATHTVTVTTSPTFDSPPDSYLTHDVIRGQAPLTVNLKLTVTGDNEGDAVSASWHIPSVGEILLDSGDFPGSAGTHAQSVTFDTPGEYEIYATVNDSWTRYGSGGSAAGPGFRDAYRRVVRVTEVADDITTFADVTADAVPDLAGFSGTAAAKPGISVFSGSNGDVASAINFANSNWRGVALSTVRDGNQDNTVDDPAVAMLIDQKSTKKIRVETRDISSKAFLGSIQFLNEKWRALDLVVVDDLNGDGNTSDTAIGVLAVRTSDGRIQLQLRDFDNGALISNVVYLNARWSAIAAAVVDRSAMAPAGTLPPLIGVIGENPTNGARLLQSRVAAAGTFDRNIKFLGSAWNYHDVSVAHDANADGSNSDPIWQVFATREEDLVMRVQTRFVSDGSFDDNIVILNDNWEGLRIDSAMDMGGGSASQEMAISALRRSDDLRRLHIKDYASGSTTLNINQ
jgi:hypothetical protein